MESYEKTVWEDSPSKNTPITAEKLNKLEGGIYNATEEVNKKMDVENPVGTGSFSMNRKADTEVGYCSTAEGYNCTASGQYSHAEGHSTIASGSHSRAEGWGTLANGHNSHAEGCDTTASGNYSHAEGYSTVTGGLYSHAEGYYTVASGHYQHVQGIYNVTDNKYAHIVGGGTSDTNRKNIHTLDWQGNAVFAGDVTNGNGVSMDGLKALIEELSTQVQTLTAQLEALQATE